MRLAIRLLVLILASTVQAAAQAPEPATAPDFPVGEIVPEVATLADPDQTYALYLPTHGDGPRPLLIVLDPRGRAEAALELFQAGAEHHGWVVLSSHQSRSDTDSRITIRALEALLREAGTRYPVDSRRLYLAGMSGTAKVLWNLLPSLEGHLAGILGCGGGRPPELGPLREISFAYFGMAGSADFNYRDMHRLDALLAKIDAARRLEIFDGRHGWPPDAALPSLGIDWLELDAMRRGLAPRRDDFVRAELERARERVENAADPLDRWRLLAQAARDFQGLRGDEAAAFRRLADALAKEKAVKALRGQESRLAGEEERSSERLGAWMARLRQPDARIQPTSRALFDLRVPQLQKRAAATDNPRDAAAARRMLETMFVWAVFYLPREFEAADRPRRAEAARELAAAIFPERVRPSGPELETPESRTEQ